MQYKGFLSYSHAADDKLAPAVQSALHRFARPWYRLRSMWIFRDRTGLGATPSLWGAIEKALSESEYFLLMASPDAATSPWIQREINWWLSNRSVSEIVILLTDGEIKWNYDSNDFDWSTTTALPPKLRGHMQEVPSWVDLRWARTEEKLALRHTRFRGAIVDIACQLLNKSKESLDSEDVRVYKRNRWAAYSAVTLTLLLAAGAAIEAVRERRSAKEAEYQRSVAIDKAHDADANAIKEEKQRILAENERTNAQNQARIANSGRIAAAALLHKDDQLDLASLLSIEAGTLSDTFEARNALFTTFEANPGLVTYLRHIAAVRSVDFSPDGKTLATGSTDGTICLWDVARHKTIGKLKGHTKWVVSVSFSKDGKTLASGGNDNTVRLWDVARHKNIAVLQGHTESVNSVAFSPDGKTLASASGALGSQSGEIRLWDVARHEPVGEPLKGKGFSSVSFSRDGKMLASGGIDEGVRLWDVSSHRLVGKPLEHDGDFGVNSVAFSPDGKTLASGSGKIGDPGWKICLWDVATGSPIGEPLTGETDGVSSIAFSPDGRTLASGGADKTVLLWDTAFDKAIGEQFRGHAEGVLSIAFSPDGRTLASGGKDNMVPLWNIILSRPLMEPLIGHEDPVLSVAFSPDGRRLASGSADGTVRLWDATGRIRVGYALTDHGDIVNSVAFSPNGGTLASGSNDGTVRLWDLNHPARGLTIINPGPGTSINPDPVTSVAFSPNGNTLAAGSIDGILWCDLVNRKVTFETFKRPNESVTEGINGVAFSPDGNMLASATGRLSSPGAAVLLWSIPGHKPIGEPLKGHAEGVTSIAFSPDGKLLASGSEDQTVWLWDLSRRQPLPPLLPATKAPYLVWPSARMARGSPRGAWTVLSDYGSSTQAHGLRVTASGPIATSRK